MLAEDYPVRNWPSPPVEEVDEHEDESGYVIAEIQDQCDSDVKYSSGALAGPVIGLVAEEDCDEGVSGRLQSRIDQLQDRINKRISSSQISANRILLFNELAISVVPPREVRVKRVRVKRKSEVHAGETQKEGASLPARPDEE